LEAKKRPLKDLFRQERPRISYISMDLLPEFDPVQPATNAQINFLLR